MKSARYATNKTTYIYKLSGFLTIVAYLIERFFFCPFIVQHLHPWLYKEAQNIIIYKEDADLWYFYVHYTTFILCLCILAAYINKPFIKHAVIFYKKYGHLLLLIILLRHSLVLFYPKAEFYFFKYITENDAILIEDCFFEARDWITKWFIAIKPYLGDKIVDFLKIRIYLLWISEEHFYMYFFSKIYYSCVNVITWLFWRNIIKVRLEKEDKC